MYDGVTALSSSQMVDPFLAELIGLGRIRKLWVNNNAYGEPYACVNKWSFSKDLKLFNLSVLLMYGG